jgi:hypothetical protein
VLTLAALLPAAGCSSGDQGSADATADAQDTQDGASDAATDAFTFDRQPFPQVPNVGNRTLVSPRLVTIVASNDDMSAELQAFSAIVPQSSFWTAVSAEYALGTIAPVASLVGPAINAGQYSSAELSTYIQNVIADSDAGTSLAPNGNTIYLVYMPDDALYSGTFSQDCGYHTSFPYQASSGDQLATVSRCTPVPDQETPLGQLTRVATHEIAESATDPLGKGYNLGETSATPWTSSVWQGWVGAGLIELGDLCEGTRIFQTFDGGPDGGWEYQRIWSNANAGNGGDPCIPPQVSPYESVSAPQGWYTVTAGSVVTIPLEGWSVAATSNWLLHASFVYGTEAFDTIPAADIGLTSSLGIGTSGTCYTRYAMNAGQTATVSLTVPSSAASGDYGVLSIESFREKPSPSCYPPITEDDHHFWLVGLHVP